MKRMPIGLVFSHRRVKMNDLFFQRARSFAKQVFIEVEPMSLRLAMHNSNVQIDRCTHRMASESEMNNN